MKRIIYLSLVILATLIVASLMSYTTGDQVQPVNYNHQIHVEGEGIECIDCHSYAEENPRASIPKIELCRDCHEEAIGDSEAELALIKYISDNKELPWIQVHVVPDHVYFSHRRHVVLGNLECTVCHGEVEKLSLPFTQPHVEITMDWCVNCHDEQGAAVECYACHR